MSGVPTVTTAAPLMTQNEAARILGLKNPRTLAAWRLRREGPPYIRCGRAVRYAAQDVMAWLAGRRVAVEA